MNDTTEPGAFVEVSFPDGDRLWPAHLEVKSLFDGTFLMYRPVPDWDKDWVFSELVNGKWVAYQQMKGD